MSLRLLVPIVPFVLLLLPSTTRAAPADDLATHGADLQLRALLAEALDRNPEIAAAKARALAADQAPAQFRGLPDPMLRSSLSAEPPTLRSDVVNLEVMLSQELPARGRRSLQAGGARADAAAARARLEATRLDVVTRIRRLYVELGRLDEVELGIKSQRDLVGSIADQARARIGAGESRDREIPRLEIERTRAEMALAEVESRDAATIAEINALRDRPPETPIGHAMLPDLTALVVDPQALAQAAVATRPEVAEASAMIDAAGTRVGLARKAGKPDIELGGWYMATGSADDDMDEVGMSVGLRLPVHPKRIAAGVELAVQEQLAATADRHATLVRIANDVQQALSRFERARRQLDIAQRVLAVQADAAVRSALAAYSAGDGAAADVLDAARLRRDAETDAAAARAEAALAVVDLEAVVGAPLEALAPQPASALAQIGGAR